jgi:hypothetical protein
MIALGRDDGETALADSAAGIEIANATMAALPKYPAYIVRAYVLAQLGDLDEARRVTEKLLRIRLESTERVGFGGDAPATWTWERVGLLDEMLAAMGTGPSTPWLEAARAVASGGWRSALPHYERVALPVGLAFARLQTGADADVRAALEFYRSIGAPFYTRQAEARLAAIA